MKSITVDYLLNKKQRLEKITMLTTYDYSLANIVDASGIDVILVGDSVGMVFSGYDSTLPVTVEQMIYHSSAVSRAVKNSLILCDMPFMSYQVSLEKALENAGKIMKQGNANAVKLEGGKEISHIVNKIVGSGIPVCGHIGLTPQHVNNLSGFKVQGKSRQKIDLLIEDAMALESAGAFMIVLECIPQEVSKIITEKLSIPTIGIGAGKFCDGQVIVINDLLGLNDKFKPKFVKTYSNLYDQIQKSVREFVSDVKKSEFPDDEHSFQLNKEILSELEK
jgi:3-methyl-2-oxobutanoate hydroxymethyltransferase